MEEKKENWLGAITKVVSEAEATNIRLGMRIERLVDSYFYGKLIKFLKGDDSDSGSMYFAELKPLYDEFGYEKVNRVLLAYDAELAQERKTEQGEAENE